jgi:hypothetical protein
MQTRGISFELCAILAAEKSNELGKKCTEVHYYGAVKFARKKYCSFEFLTTTNVPFV